jgi:hypothetical protein
MEAFLSLANRQKRGGLASEGLKNYALRRSAAKPSKPKPSNATEPGTGTVPPQGPVFDGVTDTPAGNAPAPSSGAPVVAEQFEKIPSELKRKSAPSNNEKVTSTGVGEPPKSM